MKPKRLNVIAPLLLCLLIPSTAMSAPAVKEVEVNGVRVSYVEQGAGEPIVFVHGAFSDLAFGSRSERRSQSDIGSSPTRRDISGPAHGPMRDRTSMSDAR